MQSLFPGRAYTSSREANRTLVWKPFILAANCEARLVCANTSDFHPEQVRAWPPPFLFSKSSVLQFWELFDSFFYCGILWHRICMISWDVLICDALPNPLVEPVKGLQKIYFHKLPSSVGQFLPSNAAVIVLLLKYSATA